MFFLGPLAFAVPWVLAALVTLPVIWWLIRIIPPAPNRVSFPAIRLLRGLEPEEDTPNTTPWWLLLLRLLIAALIILAIARPLIPSGTAVPGTGPILLAIDDGWDTANDWEARRDRALRAIDQAEREARPVILLTTAGGTGGELSVSQPADVREAIAALSPKPWPTDLEAAAARVQSLTLSEAAVAVWIAGPADRPGASRFAASLRRLGPLVVVRSDQAGPLWIDSPDHGLEALSVPVRRLSGDQEATVAIRAIGDDGRVIGRSEGSFTIGQTVTALDLTLPTELRNEVARLAIENQRSAGAAFLIDERFKRRPVGLVAATEFEGAQPLLDELFYLDRALAPFSEIRRGSVSTLLDRELAVLILADVGAVPVADRDRIEEWMADGGVVVRFAGPRLAAAGLERGGLGPEDLLPVRLRRGDRSLGGALSWSRPASLAAFGETGPFADIAVPEDVTVSRQVLAEPSIDLDEKTWARLGDGTPLVTADARGSGWLILVHTTANADWSDLPLSGLFVEMLRRVVGLSRGVGGETETELAAFEVMDGFGRLETAGAGLDRLLPEAGSAAAAEEQTIGPRLPPGYYGDEGSRRALNLGPELGAVDSLRTTLGASSVQTLEAGRDFDLRGWLFSAAIILAILDTLIGLAMRGLLPLPRVRTASASAILVAGMLGLGALSLTLLTAFPAVAQIGGSQTQRSQPVEPELFALEASLETRLGYILTGDPAVDSVSHDGLTGLSEILTRRTAIEPAAPFGVDPERDELSFFPLLYWPITREQPPLSETASARLNAYMRNGGIVLFDTRDRYEVGTTGSGTGSGLRRLIEISQDLEIPALAPVREDHVLTRSFYLLNDFPGRYAGGVLYLEDGSGRETTEVSPVLLGSNDWASAWARDDLGRYRFPVVPGGEVQREMAYRFGVNLVMYALTGNYKADQVHVPSILERLGQ